jgi:hypothetical protein
MGRTTDVFMTGLYQDCISVELLNYSIRFDCESIALFNTYNGKVADKAAKSEVIWLLYGYIDLNQN